MGLLAGAAAMSFAAPLRRARQRQAVEQIYAFDASARVAARRSGRAAEIVIDAYEQRLKRREDDRVVASAGALPGDLRIEQVLVNDEGESQSLVTILVSSHGTSRTYAVRVVGEGFDRWLLFAGLSGQVTVFNDESQVEQVLSAASGAARRDVD
jgi:type II secretory pathway pseudopilin PulG